MENYQTVRMDYTDKAPASSVELEQNLKPQSVIPSRILIFEKCHELRIIIGKASEDKAQ